MKTDQEVIEVVGQSKGLLEINNRKGYIFGVQNDDFDDNGELIQKYSTSNK